MKMAKYIERIDAIKAVNKQNAFTMTRVALIDSLNSIPAVDAVPVVRCRECMYSWEDLSGLCCSYGPCVDCPVSPDFWCANGRRREDYDAQD